MENLLSLICKYPFDENDKETLSELIKKVPDWSRFILVLNDHGIIALAAYNIEQAGLNNLIPAGAMNFMKNCLYKSMSRNIWLTNNWRLVNDLLTSSGIKHILLKGMALEYTVYGGMGLRQMNDIDILIRKEEALRAWDILREGGFKPIGILKSALHRKLLTEIGYHLPPLIKDNYVIEIHHRLLRSPIDNDSMKKAFNETVKIVIQGREAFVLSEDLHLQFLREHLDKHIKNGEFQLRLLNDIRLITHEEIKNFPINLSDSRHLAIRNPKKNAYRNLFYLVAPKYRVLYLIMDLFPSLEWMSKRYNCNSALAFFYYPKRLGKLFWLIKK